MITVCVLVDDVPVAYVPQWMVKHALEDAFSRYPDSKIALEEMKNDLRNLCY